KCSRNSYTRPDCSVSQPPISDHTLTNSTTIAMKTSNIILTSLLGSITVTTMAMMIDIGFGGGSPEYTEYDRQDISLPAFNHLQVHDNSRSVIVEAASSRSIKLFTMKGHQIPSITYHMEGDTLVIDQFENHKQVGAYFTLQVPHNDLQGITARN